MAEVNHGPWETHLRSQILYLPRYFRPGQNISEKVLTPLADLILLPGNGQKRFEKFVDIIMEISSISILENRVAQLMRQIKLYFTKYLTNLRQPGIRSLYDLYPAPLDEIMNNEDSHLFPRQVMLKLGKLSSRENFVKLIEVFVVQVFLLY